MINFTEEESSIVKFHHLMEKRYQFEPLEQIPKNPENEILFVFEKENGITFPDKEEFDPALKQKHENFNKNIDEYSNDNIIIEKRFLNNKAILSKSINKQGQLVSKPGLILRMTNNKKEKTLLSFEDLRSSYIVESQRDVKNKTKFSNTKITETVRRSKANVLEVRTCIIYIKKYIRKYLSDGLRAVSCSLKRYLRERVFSRLIKKPEKNTCPCCIVNSEHFRNLEARVMAHCEKVRIKLRAKDSKIFDLEQKLLKQEEEDKCSIKTEESKIYEQIRKTISILERSLQEPILHSKVIDDCCFILRKIYRKIKKIK